MADDLLHRKSDLIPISKKKDVKSSGNYRILKHGMEIIERIFKKQLRNEVKLDDMQMGFVPERGTANVNFYTATDVGEI